MFNLYQLVSGAHDGQGIENIAQQFGISRDQADGAIRSLMPALSSAFTAKASQPGGLGEIAGAMTDQQHQQAWSDPSAAGDPSTQQKGNQVVGSLFQNNAIVGQVLGQASQYTGIPQSTLQQMLPVVTSLALGGAATAMHNQGLGGMLGQFANGGIGGFMNQFGGANQGAETGSGAGAGGFAGMVGNIMNSFLGGGASGAGTGAGTADDRAQAGAGNTPGMPPMMQAGMDALFKMFQPGVGGQAGGSAATRDD